MAKSLVLHEETDGRELIKRVLVANGHEVVTFSEEEEALGWARSNPVDLAVVSLDLNRPNSSGWRNLKTLNKAVKILVLTQYGDKFLAKEAMKQGADAYLIKPIEIEKLEDKLASLLS
jgi:DNA-binding response OmpR family regulator